MDAASYVFVTDEPPLGPPLCHFILSQWTVHTLTLIYNPLYNRNAWPLTRFPNCLNHGQFFPATDEKVKNGHEI